MDILCWRKYRKDAYTIGRLYIDGVFFCNTLEDTDRGLAQWMNVGEISTKKINGATAIPIGDYKVTVTYSPKYRRNMPQIMNVKGFTGVRIHSGNKAQDTEGCLLLGDNTKPGMITNSRARCKRFEQMLQAAGNTADLHIVWDYDESR